MYFIVIEIYDRPYTRRLECGRQIARFPGLCDDFTQRVILIPEKGGIRFRDHRYRSVFLHHQTRECLPFECAHGIHPMFFPIDCLANNFVGGIFIRDYQSGELNRRWLKRNGPGKKVMQRYSDGV